MTGFIKRGNVIYDQERWALLQQMVAEGCSLNEMQRTLGVDYRQVKRWFPDYVPWAVGWSPGAEATRTFNRFEKTGSMQKQGRTRRTRSGSPVYVNWTTIRSRWRRGLVAADKEWMDSFFKFSTDIPAKPSEGKWALHRPDTSRGFEPGNVEWREIRALEERQW